MNKPIAPNAMPAPIGDHEVKASFTDDGYTENHAARADSPTFTKTKKALHGSRCAITGHIDTVEQHHLFVEWNEQFDIDWQQVKDIAIGAIKEWPVRDPDTMEPTGEMAPIEGFLIFKITKALAALGVDWQAFDQAKPETVIDSVFNMLALSKRFHTGKDGIHSHTLPFWVLFAFPWKSGFVRTADELKARIAAKA